MKRIGLFGGSFDPVHIGHQKIAKSFLESGYIDLLWVLPSANPPHKTHMNLTAYSTRCKMIEAAFHNWSEVKIVTIEERLSAPNYTLKTVHRLQVDHPEFKFLLCIGSDSLQQITSWFRYKELLKECELLVAKRLDFDVSVIPPEASVHFVEHEPVSFSSSDVRERLRRREPVADLVPAEVLKIINQYGLYKYG